MTTPSLIGPPETLTWVFETEPPFEQSTVPLEILETNDPPADTHIGSLRDFIARGTPRRARLDSKIAILQAALDRTRAERDILDSEIRKHEGAVSSARRLPAELVSLIFTFVPTDNVLNTSPAGPWNYSAVCKHWRSIALSLPSLWKDIYIDFGGKSHLEDVGVKGSMARLEAQMEHSAQAPLYIEFSSFSEGDADILEREYDILDILQKHCSRWETLRMVGPKVLLDFLDIRDKLPLLRAVHLRIFSEGFDEEDIGALRIFEMCPKLRTATVNPGRLGTPSSVFLPSDQLVRYDASNFMARHIDTLRLASNLVDCVLHIHKDSEPLSPNPRRIQLPCLLRLSVSTAQILDALDAPDLQELYCFDHSATLHAFLRRLQRLQTLVVTETPSAADIRRLLGAAPNVVDLGLYVPMHLAPEFLATFTPDSGLRLPSLNSLSVGFTPVNHVSALDQDLLMRTMESLWNGGHCRSSKLFCLRLSPSPDTLRRMEVLEQQGMDIQVFSDWYRFTRAMIPGHFDLYDDHCDVLDVFWGLDTDS